MRTELEPLGRSYDVVVANPPYMGAKNMNKWLSGWVKDNYPDVKGDLFSCFMVRNSRMGSQHAQMGFMTPYVWMFIGTYEKLRRFVIEQNTITSLIQLEYSGFSGATVPICTFTLQKGKVEGYRGGYIRLSDFLGADQQAPRALEALADPSCGWFYRRDAGTFKQIPGSPIAYWASDAMLEAFARGVSVADGFDAVVKGSFTGDNNRFLRLWHEVSAKFIGNDWRLYNKGGAFRRWFGNRDYVILWRNDAEELRAFPGSGISPAKYFDRGTITWSKITSGKPSFRLNEPGVFFDDASPAFVIPTSSEMPKSYYTLAFLNSAVAGEMVTFIAPTLNCQVGDIVSLPRLDASSVDDAERLVSSSLKIAKTDCDSFEGSWAFMRHPLV